MVELRYIEGNDPSMKVEAEGRPDPRSSSSFFFKLPCPAKLCLPCLSDSVARKGKKVWQEARKSVFTCRALRAARCHALLPGSAMPGGGRGYSAVC